MLRVQLVVPECAQLATEITAFGIAATEAAALDSAPAVTGGLVRT